MRACKSGESGYSSSMAKGARLPFRLSSRLPRAIFIGLPVFVLLLVSGCFLAFFWDPNLKPHQIQMGAILMGSMGLFCVVAFARNLMTWLQAGVTTVEVSANPVLLGEELQVHAMQRHDRPGLKKIEVLVVHLWRTRGGDEVDASYPIGSAIPAGSLGLKAQVDGSLRIPLDQPASDTGTGRVSGWAVELRISLDNAADLVERYPFVVRRPV